MRVGIGFDVHPLRQKRKLILGGVKIPYALGLEGYSDADVLVHSIIDALLGAASAGDIGRHFPNKPEYRGISSLLLLKKVRSLLLKKHFRVNNVDATLIAEAPVLVPFLNKMGENIAEALKVKRLSVNVKATTAKKIGFIGKGRAIACIAIASLRG